MANRAMIFDVGCHNGQDFVFYLKKGFKVVAIEANPTLCTELRQRFADQEHDQARSRRIGDFSRKASNKDRCSVYHFLGAD